MWAGNFPGHLIMILEWVVLVSVGAVEYLIFVIESDLELDVKGP